MIELVMRLNRFMIYYVITKHVLWGLLILTTPFALNTSTLAVLNKLFGDFHIGGMFLILSSILAIHGAFISKNRYLTVFFFIPMLSFIWLFGLTALNSVFQGHFADGTVRPWQFIFADQLQAIILMFFMSAVLTEPIWNRERYLP